MSSPVQPPGERVPSPEPDEISQLRSEHAVVVQALQSAIRDTTRLMRLFFILSDTAPIEQLLDRILATLSELFLADIVVLLEVHPERGFAARAAIGLPADSPELANFAAGDKHAAIALQSRTPVVVPRVKSEPTVEPYLASLGAEAVAWLPVVGDQAARGVLVLARCRSIPFASADVDLLVVMAYRIGLVLDRAHAAQEQRGLEVKLRRAEKAESLGRMAAAIAHHFNNMLGAVVGSLDLALAELPATSHCRDDLTRAREAARRAGVTSGLMLAYLGQGTDQRELVNLVHLVQLALSVLRGSFPAKVRLTTQLDAPDLTVLGSASQLTQAFTNLVVNAVEAVGSGPAEVRIAATVVPANQIPAHHLPAVDWTPKSDAYVCLEVADSGAGMPPETLEKIFDPFFSTKFTGRGLGLPVVLGTLRAHDGFVHVDSAVGQGTTARMYLPRSIHAAPAIRPPAVIPAATSSVRRIVLLADDEIFVLKTAQRGLEILGYEVVTATDGVEALSRFRQHKEDVLCAVLDLTMPRMDGWATLDAIRALEPGIPVVIASGYDTSRAQPGRSAEPAVVFLHKPYGLEEMRAALRQVLSAAAETGWPVSRNASPAPGKT